MLEEIIISAPKIPPQKPLIEVLSEYCKNDPPPIFCELPDELKVKTFSFPAVNNSAYATAASGVSGTMVSTSTT